MTLTFETDYFGDIIVFQGIPKNQPIGYISPRNRHFRTLRTLFDGFTLDREEINQLDKKILEVSR